MVQKGHFDFDGEEWDTVSNEAKDLIKKLITKPERRLTAQEALNHKWIKTMTAKKQDTKLLSKLNLSTMKQFQKSQKLKQVALMAIAVQSDPKEMMELKEIFQELDKNGDGSISFEELQVGLGKRENGQDLLNILKAADTDGNGTINYTGKHLLLRINKKCCRIFGGDDERYNFPEGSVLAHCIQNV